MAQIPIGWMPKQHKSLSHAADAIKKGSNDTGIAIIGVIVATIDLCLIKIIDINEQEALPFESIALWLKN